MFNKNYCPVAPENVKTLHFDLFDLFIDQKVTSKDKTKLADFGKKLLRSATLKLLTSF